MLKGIENEHVSTPMYKRKMNAPTRAALKKTPRNLRRLISTTHARNGVSDAPFFIAINESRSDATEVRAGANCEENHKQQRREVEQRRLFGS